jgi:riboflavin kinase/FMN adenylyltransferase
MKYQVKLIKGKGRGKKLGFPTFNLQIPQSFSPNFGIYGCWVWIDRKRYQGDFHFGPIPTFNEAKASLEIFVLNFKETKQVHNLSFELQHFLRPIKNFSTEKELITQIAKDVRRISKLLAEGH